MVGMLRLMPKMLLLCFCVAVVCVTGRGLEGEVKKSGFICLLQVSTSSDGSKASCDHAADGFTARNECVARNVSDSARLEE